MLRPKTLAPLAPLALFPILRPPSRQGGQEGQGANISRTGKLAQLIVAAIPATSIASAWIGARRGVVFHATGKHR
jgi:hypothetical protein